MSDNHFRDDGIDRQLARVRAGTTAFAEAVATVSDDALDEPTRLPGWTRRHLIAHVGYNAAALTRLLDWARTGVETPMYESAEDRQVEIDQGARLPAADLRRMCEIHTTTLDAAWADLPRDAWSAKVRTAQGRLVPAAETLWMRAREVWVHAVDLNNCFDFAQIDEHVLWSLLTDITGLWQTRDTGHGITLAAADRPPLSVYANDNPTTSVTGALADTVRWAAGRGADGVTILGEAVTPPRWL